MAVYANRQASPPAGLRRVGTDYGTEICLDEDRDGEVVSFDLEGKIATRFMSTRIETFAAGLALYAEYARRAPYATEEENVTNVEELERELRSLDPAMLGDADNWWALI